MKIDLMLVWIALAAVAALAVWQFIARSRVRARRRARTAALERELRDALESTLAGSPKAGIARLRVELISQDAQRAALQVARDGPAAATNPHPARTREFVLWEATFHSALADCEAAAEASGPGDKHQADAPH